MNNPENRLPSTEAESVTRWINDLQAGNDEGITALWHRYFKRLVNLANVRLRARDGRFVDGEDIAVSAFDSLYRGVVKGNFPKLEDREDLWRILAWITLRKICKRRALEGSAKRGGMKTVNISSLEAMSGAEAASMFDHFLDDEPTPEDAAQFEDDVRCRLAELESDKHREIALMRMEGYNNKEISKRLDISKSGVDRRLKEIRDAWTDSDSTGVE